MNERIWLVGAGQMSVDYIRVLQVLNVSYKVIGRGADSARACISQTGVPVVEGGIGQYLCEREEFPSVAIVAVGVEELSHVTNMLLERGVKKILVEKPGGLNCTEIRSVLEQSVRHNAEVYIAYNRRFYSSVRKAQEIIRDDEGVSSFNFEFTEWSHQIAELNKASGVKENWLLANSSHVIDLAFFLGGQPKQISCYKTGALDWHPSGSIYAGAGVAENGALFSYQANWEAPGRWGVEVLTKRHRLILRPLEKLQVQNIGSTLVEYVEIDEKLDIDFKPGLYWQLVTFLKKKTENMCSIEQHCKMVEVYNKIAQ